MLAGVDQVGIARRRRLGSPPTRPATRRATSAGDEGLPCASRCRSAMSQSESPARTTYGCGRWRTRRKRCPVEGGPWVVGGDRRDGNGRRQRRHRQHRGRTECRSRTQTEPASDQGADDGRRDRSRQAASHPTDPPRQGTDGCDRGDERQPGEEYQAEGLGAGRDPDVHRGRRPRMCRCRVSPWGTGDQQQRHGRPGQAAECEPQDGSSQPSSFAYVCFRQPLLSYV